MLVVGIAAFFLEDYLSKGEIQGRFIRYHASGELAPGAENYNLWGVGMSK